MQQRVAAIVGLVAALGAAPILAAPSAYDQAFADAFGKACIPGRLSYDASRAAALDAGWREVPRSDNAELDALMALSEKEAQDPELDATFTYAAYANEIDGLPHYLVVSRTSAVISEGDTPWVQVGCYLYNFDATAPVDPAPVSALLATEISQSAEQDGIVSHVWGPPCPMPRTLDTYLSFVPEGSAAAEGFVFSGAALNFTTSEPEPDEVVPDSYC